MNFNLKGKVVLITGAASGIGLATAHSFRCRRRHAVAGRPRYRRIGQSERRTVRQNQGHGYSRRSRWGGRRPACGGVNAGNLRWRNRCVSQ
jgi:NAD(P)-dependent dehydrogenase (short-subunit alcohol dehydrogenase family)